MLKKSLMSLIVMFCAVLMLSSCTTHSLVGTNNNNTSGGNNQNNNSGGNDNNTPSAPKAGDVSLFTASDVSFNMVYVPGGLTFPTGRDDSGTATVATAYQIGQTEVTCGLWTAVRNLAIGTDMGYSFKVGGCGQICDSSMNCAVVTGAGSDLQPVTYVSWYDAIIFTNALSEILGFAPVYKDSESNVIKDSSGIYPDTIIPDASANGFRLPTSNEFELAARYIGPDKPRTGKPIDAAAIFMSDIYWTPGTYASGATDYAADLAGNPNPDDTATRAVANYDYWDDYGEPVPDAFGTLAVGSLASNALGLKDMSGNVFEWNIDYIASQKRFVDRGGAWDSSTGVLRIGSVISMGNPNGHDDSGLRLSRTVQ